MGLSLFRIRPSPPLLTDAFGRAVAPAPAEGGLNLCLPTARLSFNPAAWDDDLILKAHTNCLTYALNCPEMDHARIGELRQPQHLPRLSAPFDAARLKNELEKEGLREISERDAVTHKGHVIALLISPTYDYHFLRRDDNGAWSHKRVNAAPRQTDSNGTIIRNPRDAFIKVNGFAPYDQFGGYFAVPENGILFKPLFTPAALQPR